MSNAANAASPSSMRGELRKGAHSCSFGQGALLLRGLPPYAIRSVTTTQPSPLARHVAHHHHHHHSLPTAQHQALPPPPPRLHTYCVRVSPVVFSCV